MIPLMQQAKLNAYSQELCAFLEILEDNIELFGTGLCVVHSAIDAKLPEADIIKVALANVGHGMADCDIGLPNIGKSRNEYTLQDWIDEGEEEYLHHCTNEGKFRFDDFKPRRRKSYQRLMGANAPLFG